jgi:hypothetical protein
MEETPNYVAEHPKVFTNQEHDPLPPYGEFNHEIKTTDKVPVSLKPYPLNKEERGLLFLST